MTYKVESELTLIHLEKVFRECFYKKYFTKLKGGYDEPLYLPAKQNTAAIVCYRLDYFKSALHEIAHWCFAGEVRRQQEDYGYWYAADGRNQEEQQKFYKVEIKPQAIEYSFCKALAIPFEVSTDNLLKEEDSNDKNSFIIAVNLQLEEYEKNGFPNRAELFLQRLKVSK